jgi:hypothetical protein
MNTEENDTEAELAAWELLREARLELTAARAEIAELNEEYGTWWAQKSIALDELKEVTEQRDTSKPEDSPEQEAGEGCSGASCSAFFVGQQVIHKGVKRTIYDIDEGYGIIALDGDKYISPSHPENRCIEVSVYECNPVISLRVRRYKRVADAVKAAYKINDDCLLDALTWTESYLMVIEHRIRKIFDDSTPNDTEESERLRNIFLPNTPNQERKSPASDGSKI